MKGSFRRDITRDYRVADRRSDLIYPIPDPYDTIEQYERHLHRDVPHLDDDALNRERGRARQRWLSIDTRRSETEAERWLVRRIAALDLEWRRRSTQVAR